MFLRSSEKKDVKEKEGKRSIEFGEVQFKQESNKNWARSGSRANSNCRVVIRNCLRDPNSLSSSVPRARSSFLSLSALCLCADSLLPFVRLPWNDRRFVPGVLLLLGTAQGLRTIILDFGFFFSGHFISVSPTLFLVLFILCDASWLQVLRKKLTFRTHALTSTVVLNDFLGKFKWIKREWKRITKLIYSSKSSIASKQTVCWRMHRTDCQGVD
jgi:hypothetical protein